MRVRRPGQLRGGVAIAAVTGLVAGLTACTVGPSDRPPVAVRNAEAPEAAAPPPTSRTPIPPRQPGEYDPSSLAWDDCTDSVQLALGQRPSGQVDCAEVTVQADRSVPSLGGPARIGLTRVGNGPAPLVVVGEPGAEPGALQAVRLAGQLPDRVLDAYTIIGLSRRGTGSIDPLVCISEQTRHEIIGFDPDVREERQLNRLLETTRTAIQTCIQDVGERLTVLDSTNAAQDLEQLRIALGAPVLNVLAYGESSAAVTGFLREYPDAAGRVVLDGAADPTLDAIASAEASAIATERGFDAFAADCVARSCPLAPDPREFLRQLADQLRATPLRAGATTVTAGTAYQAVLETLGSPERWPQLTDALVAARSGDPSGIRTLVAPLVSGVRGLPARFDAALATHCNDTPARVPPERVEQLVEQWRSRAPLFGPLFAQRLLLCSSWPVPSEQRTPQPGPLAPLVVVATTGDPVTPASGANRTADQLRSAALVRWEGSAHGAVPRSSCVTDLVAGFLVDAQVPAQSTLCPP